MMKQLTFKSSKDFLRSFILILFVSILSFSPCERLVANEDNIIKEKKSLTGLKQKYLDESVPEVEKYVTEEPSVERIPAGSKNNSDYDVFDFDKFDGEDSFASDTSSSSSGSFAKYRKTDGFGKLISGRNSKSSIEGYHEYEMSVRDTGISSDGCVNKSSRFDFSGLSETIRATGLAATLILGTYYNYDLAKRSINSKDAFMSAAMSKEHGQLNLPQNFFNTDYSSNLFLSQIFGSAGLNANLNLGMGNGNMGFGIGASAGTSVGNNTTGSYVLPQVNGQSVPMTIPQGQQRIINRDGNQYSCTPIQIVN